MINMLIVWKSENVLKNWLVDCKYIDWLKMYWLIDFLGLGEAVERVGGV